MGATLVVTTISVAGIVLWVMLETEWPVLVQEYTEGHVIIVEHSGKDGLIPHIQMNTTERFTEQFVSQGVSIVPVRTRSTSK